MYLVFDIGGSSVKYALITIEGEIVEKGKRSVPSYSGATSEDFIDNLVNIYEEKKDMSPEGIAISLPGQIDVKRGIVYGGGAFPYMDKVPLGEILSKRCDNLPVALENDAKCAALAEVWLGNAKDVKDCAVLVFGTGIGGAVVRNRKVIHGKHLLAGEVSYMIENMTREDLKNVKSPEERDPNEGLTDYLEKVYFHWAASHSTVSMCYWFAKKKGIPYKEVTGEMIYKMADEGDEIAIDTLEDMYFSIAKKCINIYLLVDPEVILIGGGISHEPRFIEGIRKYVKILMKPDKIFDHIRIDTCKYMNDSNLYGALFNLLQREHLDQD